MPRPGAEPAKCFGGPKRMKQLRGFATVLFLAFVAWDTRDANEERFERIPGNLRGDHFR